MLTDFRDHPAGALVEADLCVIGGGAAGITLARQFLGTAIDVVLLESGGADYEAEAQDLSGGRNLGMHYYELAQSRLRLFGGTTVVWGGRCVPLGDLDFESRPGMPWSGWPLTPRDLDPWYRRAHESLGLGAYDYGASVGGRAGVRPPAFDPEIIASQYWRFDPVRDRFTLGNCRDILEAENVRILLHANAVHLQANRHASAIEYLDIATPEGMRGRVRARHYVLACGGIENPRLLLASRDVEAAGIGNGSDLVGRFFMEHPHGRAGRVVVGDAHRLWTAFRRSRDRDDVPVALTLVPGDRLRREQSTLNCSLTVKLQREPKKGLALNKRLYNEIKHQMSPTRSGRRLWRAYRDIRSLSAKAIRPWVERVRVAAGLRTAYLIVRAEQAPNPASRVTLSTERDALGVPRADLDWRLSGADKESVARVIAALDGEFARLGLGRVEPAEWLSDSSPEWPTDPTVSNHPIGGYHHMGTTRMADDPRRGVVDADGRVHGYGNLYVAGSSVFPTGGWANPTLTLLALTLRLGHHLRARASAGASSDLPSSAFRPVADGEPVASRLQEPEPSARRAARS